VELRRFARLVLLSAALGGATGCGDDDLKSGSVCPDGQEQVCDGNGEKLRCACVTPDAGTDAGDSGSDG
jgi:hypothetical protein